MKSEESPMGVRKVGREEHPRFKLVTARTKARTLAFLEEEFVEGLTRGYISF